MNETSFLLLFPFNHKYRVPLNSQHNCDQHDSASNTSRIENKTFPREASFAKESVCVCHVLMFKIDFSLKKKMDEAPVQRNFIPPSRLLSQERRILCERDVFRKRAALVKTILLRSCIT